jgi:hypothetical protein
MTRIVMKAVFTNKLHGDTAANNLAEAGFKPKQQILKDKSILSLKVTDQTSPSAQEILQDSGAESIKSAKDEK